MTAPTKNSVSPTAAAIPIRGMLIPPSNPSAPAALRTPRVVSDDSGTPNFAMLARSHSGAGEVVRGRIDVGGSGHDSDDDVGSKHEDLFSTSGSISSTRQRPCGLRSRSQQP